jgi:hypothetical protein
LKIDSGEHLAAILLTAFLGRPPTNIDVDGGIDLIFTTAEESTLSAQPMAAFEVKSLEGSFRRIHSEIRRDEGRGVDARGRGTSVTVRSAEDILRSGVPQLRKSAEQLNRKVQGNCSRNAFIVIHPFEHMAAESVNVFMSPHLPPMPDDINLDSVWVLWVPDHLTMWSRAEQQWTEMMFLAFDPEDPVDADASYHDLSVLQAASLRLLSRIRPGVADPYVFGLTTKEPDSGP